MSLNQTNIFYLPLLKGTLLSLRPTHFFDSVIFMLNQYLAHPKNYLDFTNFFCEDHEALIGSISGLVT